MSQFVCKECCYPSRKDDSCDNPACLANPMLSEAHKANLRAIADKVAIEKAEWEAKKAFKASLRKQGFTTSF